MRYLVVLSTLVVALGASATAGAGGWATVGIAPLPDGTDAGGTWAPKITILQHGRTPLDGLSPIVTIFDQNGATHEFIAVPTAESGVYDASVTFPEAGSWSVVVDSTFGDSRLTYGPVTVAGGGAEGGGWSLPTTGVLAVIVALALLAAFALGIRRVRRLTPAS